MSNPTSCGPGAISTTSSWLQGKPFQNGALALAALVFVFCSSPYLTQPGDSPKCDVRGEVSSDGSQVGFTPDDGQTSIIQIDPDLGLAGQKICFEKKDAGYHFGGSADEAAWREAWNAYLAKI